MRGTRRAERSRRRDEAIGRTAMTIVGQVQARACDRKGQYTSKAKAKASAALMKRKHGAPTFVYECASCGCWHLTTQRPEEYRARYRAPAVEGES